MGQGWERGHTHEDDIEALRAGLEFLHGEQAVNASFKVPVVLFHVGGEQHHVYRVVLDEIVSICSVKNLVVEGVLTSTNNIFGRTSGILFGSTISETLGVLSFVFKVTLGVSNKYSTVDFISGGAPRVTGRSTILGWFILYGL